MATTASARRLHATQPTPPSSKRAARSVAPAVNEGAEREDRRREGRRRGVAAELLEQHRDLYLAEPEAAVGFRQRHRGPTLLAHRGPQPGVVSGTAVDGSVDTGVDDRAYLRGPGEAVEQVASPVAQRQLVVGKFEVHRRGPYPRRRIRWSEPRAIRTPQETGVTEPTAHLRYLDTETELPVVRGSEGELGLDISKLRDQTGLVTLDYGYTNTGSCESEITFIDGEEGILRYRGIPIEQLVEGHMPSFLETSYLLIYGNLPTRSQLDEFRYGIRKHTLLHEDAKRFFDAFPKDAHPMGVLSSVVERALHLLPGQHRPARPRAGAAVDHPPHGEAADDRGVLVQEVDRPAAPLPEQQPRPHRELPDDDVRGSVGALRGQPAHRARDEAAAHPARRPRAELLDVDGAAGRFQ